MFILYKFIQFSNLYKLIQIVCVLVLGFVLVLVDLIVLDCD